MKKGLTFILTSIVSIVLLFFATIGYQNNNTSIKVMSFNIRCIAIEANPINGWENRKDDVIEVILKHKPDLIGFQELTYFQYTFMKENLEDEYDDYTVFRSAIPLFSESSAIFYKKNRFEVLDSDTFWLSETPEEMSKGWDADLERVCSRLTLKDKVTDKVFNHFNTHFDHKGVIARQQSVYLILNKVEISGLPSIVTGDLNLHEKSENYNNLVNGGLKDTKYLAPEDASDDGPTYNGFRDLNGEPIDFIFATQGDFLIKSYSIIRDADSQGNYPSDHFPIMAVIKQF